MTFAEAMAALDGGHFVRRKAWRKKWVLCPYLPTDRAGPRRRVSVWVDKMRRGWCLRIVRAEMFGQQSREATDWETVTEGSSGWPFLA